MSDTRKPVSLAPEDATEGLLWSNEDVEIKTARFGMYDFQGKAEPAPCLILNIIREDGSDAVEALSAGKAADWEPHEDGIALLPIKDPAPEGINVNTKTMKFLNSLVNAGFPSPELRKGDISILDGLGFHAVRVAGDYKDMQGREGRRDITVLNVAKINYLPGEKRKRGGKKTSGKASEDAAKAEELSAKDAEIEEAATNALMELLTEDGQVEVKSIPTKIWKKLQNISNKNAVIKKAYDSAFLSRDGMPWEVDSGIVKLPD